MRKIIITVVLLCVSVAVQAAPTCKGLVGTWNAKFTIFMDPTINEFTIDSVGSDGLISGVHFYNRPIKGYCKRGVVNISEVYSDFILYSYYFVNEPKGFGQFMATSSYLYDFDHSWYSAEFVKISSASSKEKTNNDSNKIDDDQGRLQLIEELKQKTE